MRTFCASSLVVLVSAATRHTKILTSGSVLDGSGAIQGFTYPRMGGMKGDRVTFGAYTDQSNAVEVFDASGFGFQDSINETTVDDHGNKFSGLGGGFSLSTVPHPSDDPVTVFVSSVNGEQGIFLKLPSGRFVTVVTTKTMSPSGSVFSSLAQPEVDVSADQSEIFVSFAARADSSWRGVMLATIPIIADDEDVTVVLTTVADTDTIIPGFGVNFNFMSAPHVSRQGDVVFFGAHCGQGKSAAKMVSSDCGEFLMSHEALPTDREVNANWASQDAVAPVGAGLWRLVPGAGLEAVVNVNTPIPGGTSGEAFRAFSDPVVGYDGTVAFIGRGNAGSYGMYKRPLGASSLTVVANNQMDVPGYTDRVFKSFPHLPSIDEIGQLVFFGQCDATVGGVFYEDLSQHRGLGTILNYEDQIEGVNIIYIGFGKKAYSGGKASLYLVLDNNATTNGVWTFDAPRSGVVLV